VYNNIRYIQKNSEARENNQLISVTSYLFLRTNMSKAKTVKKSSIGKISIHSLAKWSIMFMLSFVKNMNIEKAKIITNKRKNVFATILLMV